MTPALPSMEALNLIGDVLVPALSQISGLISSIAAGTRSLAVAKAELAGILAVAQQRLNTEESDFVRRDALEDARVTPTLPAKK